MTVQTVWALDALVAAYGHHLRRARGLRESTLKCYAFQTRRFLRVVLGDDPIDIADLQAADIPAFLAQLQGGMRPRGLGAVATALRSFLRFLRAEGMHDGRLEAAVPTVAQWRLSALPTCLTDAELERLLATTAAATGPYATRDRAIVTCLSRLGLRPCELADLRLEDIDWEMGTIRLRAHKTRRDGTLPLPHDAGSAIVAYLSTDRPSTSERRVFVQHRKGAIGAPLARSGVSGAVRRALRRAGVQARISGAYVLRHTVASRMVCRGASIKEVADFLGHRSLDTTAIYAKLDLPTLRKVALPWPEVTR